MSEHPAIDQVRELADRIRDLQNSLICEECRRRLAELAAHELTQAIGHGKTVRDADVVRVTFCANCAEQAHAFRRAFLEFGIGVAPWEADDGDSG
jgi:hypothetical protein